MHRRGKRQPVFLAVGQPLELRHEFALVVFDFHGIRADLEILRHFPGLGPSVPVVAAFMKVMLTFNATDTVPCELQAAAKQKSASVKMAPPWTVPSPFQ